MRKFPACHIFTVGTENFAYDLNSQQLLAVEPELAEALQGGGGGSAAALEVLRRAQDMENLFLSHRPRLVPQPTGRDAEVDKDLQHLILTVTEACNLRCAYCLHGANLGWVRDHGQRRMSVDTAVAAVEYFLDRRDLERDPVISFYGGEALMNMEVVEAVVAAAHNHPRGGETIFAIDTNGVLMDDTVIDFILKDLELREKFYLQISIDGPAAMHDRYRRDTSGQPTFDRIMANIGRLLDRDPTAANRLTSVLTLAPPVDLFAVADLFAAFPPYLERGITKQPKVTVNFANLKGQKWRPGQEEAIGLPTVLAQIELAREMYLKAFAASKRHEISPVIRALFEPELIRFYHRSRAPLGENYTPGGNCRPGRRKLHVTVDGRLQPCERTGNVVSLGTIKTGIRVRRVRKLDEDFHNAVKDRCGSCWALRLCNVCFAAQAENVNLETGELPVPESVCRRVRAQKRETLKMMVRILAMPAETREWLDQTELV
ncbi:MAG: radical SAM protein [Gemmatimonadales bacterium]|nr:radical SAM protein [Gemmatimonadales bacterium]